MSVIETVKEDRLKARKISNKDKLAFLGFLIGEIEKVGKDKGNRETTNDEAIVVVRKILGNVELALQSKQTDELLGQKSYLETLLPQMVSDDEVEKAIKQILFYDKDANKGVIMKNLRGLYGVAIDMKSAGAIADKLMG